MKNILNLCFFLALFFPLQSFARTDLYPAYCATFSSSTTDKFDLTFTKIDARNYTLVIAQQDSTFTVTATSIFNYPRLRFKTSYTDGTDTTRLVADFNVGPARMVITGSIVMTTGTDPSTTLTMTAREGVCPPSATSLLPDISTFTGAGLSDRFVVDATYMTKGFPFKGTRARGPHQGGHVHITNPLSGSSYTWPDSTGKYVPIYAVANGTIARVDSYFAVDANYRYGISLNFAKKDSLPVSFEYSIEPMINPGDASYYLPYITTTAGASVTKGDVLGYFYIPDGSTGDAHIHFHLSWSSGFYAPSIFTSAVVTDFYDHFGEFGLDQTDSSDPGVAIGACMGYMLSATENIFGTGDVDCQ